VADDIPLDLAPVVSTEDDAAPPAVRGSNDSNLVPALVRGLRLMQAFSPARPKLPMSELVAYLDAPRSTVARLVRSLVEMAFLTEDDAGRLSPGPAVLGIGASYLAGATEVRIAATLLDALADQSLAAAQLLALDGEQVVVLAQALPAAPQRTCAATRVGARFALTGTGCRTWSSSAADAAVMRVQDSAGGAACNVWTYGEVTVGGGGQDDAPTLPLMAVPILRRGRAVYAISVAMQEGHDAASMVERAAHLLARSAGRFTQELNRLG
jgi:DNA-binding IclR family transcriptional regulator